MKNSETGLKKALHHVEQSNFSQAIISTMAGVDNIALQQDSYKAKVYYLLKIAVIAELLSDL